MKGDFYGKKVKKRDLLITASGKGSVSKRLHTARLLQAVLDITGEAGMGIADAKETLRQLPDILDSSVCVLKVITLGSPLMVK